MMNSSQLSKKKSTSAYSGSRLFLVHILIILLVIFPYKVYSEPTPPKISLPSSMSNINQYISNRLSSSIKLKKINAKDSIDDNEERIQLLPIITRKSKATLNSSLAISKEIAHVGLVISVMKASVPFILAATDKLGKYMVCSLNSFVKTISSYMKDGPAFLERFICEEVLNPKYPFFILRSETYGDNRKESTSTRGTDGTTYQPVVLTRNSQKLLFFLSLITEFNLIPSRKLKSKPFIYYVATKYINRRKLYVTGSLLRGLQLSTGIENLFDPSIGACALINFGASWSGFGWIRSLVIGWTLSYEAWKICGTKRPQTPQ